MSGVPKPISIFPENKQIPTSNPPQDSDRAWQPGPLTILRLSGEGSIVANNVNLPLSHVPTGLRRRNVIDLVHPERL